MGFPFRKFYGMAPVPTRWFEQDITSNAYEDANGFFARAITAGDITYRPFRNEDGDGTGGKVTQTVAAGDYLGPHPGGPGALLSVDSNSTVRIMVFYYA